MVYYQCRESARCFAFVCLSQIAIKGLRAALRATAVSLGCEAYSCHNTAQMLFAAQCRIGLCSYVTAVVLNHRLTPMGVRRLLNIAGPAAWTHGHGGHKSRAGGLLAGWATPVTVFPVAPLGGQDEFLVALEDATMAAMGAEAALEELMEESVPAVMVLCEVIMCLAPFGRLR